MDLKAEEKLLKSGHQKSDVQSEAVLSDSHLKAPIERQPSNLKTQEPALESLMTIGNRL